MNHAYNINFTTLYAQTLFRFLKKIVRKFISDSFEKAPTNEESLLTYNKAQWHELITLHLLKLQGNRVQ
jgi:hypothetical protein